jgi:transcriptional regulator with XRE-family HTH domain
MRTRDLTQRETAVYAGVSMATVSDILHKGHLPKLDTLFRLADSFETPREQLLRLAANMRQESGDGDAATDLLAQELLDEFRKLPDEWKEEAVNQVALLARLASQPPARLVGDEGEG